MRNVSTPPLIRAITLDLDDTLWPFPPIGERIERVLHTWFETHAPRTAAQFPIPAMRRLRERVMDRYPQQSHDASWLRRKGIEIALAESGSDPALADEAYAAFFAERNRVDFYDDARDALARIAARVPVYALSNGNADLATIGIDQYFTGKVTAREFGRGKPDASIFLHACDQLGVAPHEVLHVGDDVEADIVGAHRAGLMTCWLHRDDARERHPTWPKREFVPSLILPTLAALADWLDMQPRHEDAP
ncbi:putative hydrolase of the HAD superfamily [Solilutibacter tolerans]|uniref:Putative hydrolase of the HAD superfamily n=1 Tax=Solilutibacter tolerans TaxID=1604334 RepID=A0A1N6QHY5_9GAMM|nr:putative hydrolase of the HAD superfamily [Lysobacter tolerans]